MIHDQLLLDRLCALPTERFEGVVYRVTTLGADPVAASTSGGRWAPPPEAAAEVSVLYTSLERDEAIAEVASYLSELTPVPRARLKLSRLVVSMNKTLRLVHADLAALGVDTHAYGTRDYAKTQEIGAALSFLELDGLIAPSARWSCDNLMIFAANHSLNERLDIVDSEEIDWRAWARMRGMLSE